MSHTYLESSASHFSLNLGRFLKKNTNKVAVSCLLLFAILALKARQGLGHGAHGRDKCCLFVDVRALERVESSPQQWRMQNSTQFPYLRSNYPTRSLSSHLLLRHCHDQAQVNREANEDLAHRQTHISEHS